MWGWGGGVYGGNAVLCFVMRWGLSYLGQELHFSMGTMAKIGGLGYLCYAAAAAVFGWISDRWIAAGGSPTLVRKTFDGVGAGSAGLLLLACAPAGPAASAGLLLLPFAPGRTAGSLIS